MVVKHARTQPKLRTVIIVIGTGFSHGPIGNTGWIINTDSKPVYDQQVIEATDMVMAAVAGKKVSKQNKYEKNIQDWLSWFHGNNIKKIDMIDRNTFGCFDALIPSGINPNQGAESILCYLLADLAVANPKVILK